MVCILTYYYVIHLIGTYNFLGLLYGAGLIFQGGASVCGGPRYII